MDSKKRIEELRSILKIDQKKSQIKQIEDEMKSPSFWLDEKDSQLKAKQLKDLNNEIKEFEDVYEMVQIASEDEMKSLAKEIDGLEIKTYFSGRYDNYNAILNFYAGAGGVDAQDWTEMLLKMYLGWAEKEGLDSKILDISHGGEAGIKSATIEIEGLNTYGKLKKENGVHRLVRQSPFNAKNLRQTSFSLVEVLPDIDNETDIDINPSELRIDTFRASGHGGQSVNTTDSAVRIVHTPTGLVSSCQNERSQLQNRDTAMKMLRSRLAALLIEQHKDKIADIKGDFSSPEWGNQIRSYVLHPYKMVKDHRTNFESKDPDKILQGELDGFIEAEIRL